MRVIVDTNVFVSGVFFTGPPAQILEAWRGERITVVLSAAIIEEYRRVGIELAKRYQGADLEPLLALLLIRSELVDVPALPEPVCEDPDDDKFLACVLYSDAPMVVSGDKHLLSVSRWRGVAVLSPRAFVDRFLSAGSGSRD